MKENQLMSCMKYSFPLLFFHLVNQKEIRSDINRRESKILSMSLGMIARKWV